MILGACLLPAAAVEEGRSKEVGVKKKVKRLLEQRRAEIKEEHTAAEKIWLMGCVCRLGTAGKHLLMTARKVNNPQFMPCIYC